MRLAGVGQPVGRNAGRPARRPWCARCRNADGSALRERLARGEQPKVTLHAEVDTGWRQTPILVAEIDGPDADGPFILYSGHHDTWHYGVMDNGAANATMLEVARLTATRARACGGAGCGCASGRGTRMAAIPVPPGMPISTGTNWNGAVRCM